MAKLRMNQAIALAIAEEMRDDPSVVVFGEDVAAAGGPFKTSEGLLEEFGPIRVRDTPISEMGFLGAAVGAASTGLRPVVEIMFIEFLGVALDQLSTEAAKFHFLSQGRVEVPLVVRASVGAGTGFGSQHSQTLENWLTATPGLKVAVASGARTAYGLMRAAIRDPNPVILLEPRALYGERETFDPGEDAILQLGAAERITTGDAATVVATGQMVRTAAAALGAAGIQADLIDLRSLVPWDREMVLGSVERTGRLITVEEGPYTGGWGTQIVAEIATTGFASLRAPALRITAPDTPVPFSTPLESRWLPSVDYVQQQIEALVQRGERPLPWWEKEVTP
jgi:acetoin:2,6-dichlorophenolindophenol oxidoreductase subunit beta